MYKKLKEKDRVELMDKLYDPGEKDWSKERLAEIDLMEKQRNRKRNQKNFV